MPFKVPEMALGKKKKKKRFELYISPFPKE